MISISRLYCGRPGQLDHLRYSQRGGQTRQTPADRRPVVVWNCTARCNLTCDHCYAATSDGDVGSEMDTAAAKAMLDDLARFAVPVVLFSGGEPMLREDLTELISHAAAAGLRAVVSTNGMLIDRAAAERLRQAGASYVGVSLDGLAAAHDRFRGAAGSFQAALAGIRNCRSAGLKVGLRFTVTGRNADQIGAMFSLLADEDIPRGCFYHLVYAGRGRRLMAEDLDHDACRAVVDEIIDRTAAIYAAGLTKEILTVDNHADGPYLYLRMVREGDSRAEQVLRLLRANGGNASGIGIAAIGWDGEVHADQFWRHASFGNVTERPFSRIWTDTSHPLMARLKDRRGRLRGRCRRCRFLDACNGNMRVRAEAAGGDIWGDDPACYLSDQEIAIPEGAD